MRVELASRCSVVNGPLRFPKQSGIDGAEFQEHARCQNVICWAALLAKLPEPHIVAMVMIVLARNISRQEYAIDVMEGKAAGERRAKEGERR